MVASIARFTRSADARLPTIRDWTRVGGCSETDKKGMLRREKTFQRLASELQTSQECFLSRLKGCCPLDEFRFTSLYGEKRTQLTCARDKAELCSYENVRLDTAQLCLRIARMCERTSLLRAGHTPFGRSRAVCEQMKASSKHSSTVPSHSSASC